MPIFEMQGPDGKTYEVEAPDMGVAASAFGAMAGPGVGDLSMRNVATAAARGVPILGGLGSGPINLRMRWSRDSSSPSMESGMRRHELTDE
ncbi:hypothetical protein ACLBXM_18790, partial [Xanthobacteraceae bacterium A53D]